MQSNLDLSVVGSRPTFRRNMSPQFSGQNAVKPRSISSWKTADVSEQHATIIRFEYRQTSRYRSLVYPFTGHIVHSVGPEQILFKLKPGIHRSFSEQTNKQTPWPLVRERTIPTERPPLVDEI
jgi:hypothetical protein